MSSPLLPLPVPCPRTSSRVEDKAKKTFCIQRNAFVQVSWRSMGNSSARIHRESLPNLLENDQKGRGRPERWSQAVGVSDLTRDAKTPFFFVPVVRVVSTPSGMDSCRHYASRRAASLGHSGAVLLGQRQRVGRLTMRRHLPLTLPAGAASQELDTSLCRGGMWLR
jgi:hypothetical protein